MQINNYISSKKVKTETIFVSENESLPTCQEEKTHEDAPHRRMR